MSPAVLLFTVYFLFVSFLSDIPETLHENPLLSYYYLHGRLIFDNWIIYLLLLLAVIFILFSKGRYQKKASIISITRIVLISVFVSSFLSLVLLFFLAFFQLNITSLLINLGSSLSGVERNADKISERLKDQNIPPEVIVGNEDDGTLLTSVAVAQSGKDSFYGGRIVKSIPKFFAIPVKKGGSGALLVGNTLIISRVSSDDFQKISPVVSYLLIKNYFSEKEIKKYPQVDLMDKSTYENSRQEDFKKKAEVLDEVVTEIESRSVELSSEIVQKQQQLSDSEEDLEFQKIEKEDEYNSCVNEGYYEEDEYIKVNTKEECREEIIPLNEGISELNEEIRDLEKGLQDDSTTLKQYEGYIDYYNGQKTLTEQSTGFVSFEFASFEPPDKIQVALTEKIGTQTVADYFVILVHEYLHYNTFNEEGRSLATGFFTEGLTEYFARKIVKSNLGIETNVSYPVNVKLIEQLGKRISDSDLSDIYFSNDEIKLSELLDRAYGEGFYKRNLVLLETLHYTSDVSSVLEIGSSIMQEIGGDFLTEEDTKTTYSTFE